MNTSLADLLFLISGWSVTVFSIGILGWMLGNRWFAERVIGLSVERQNELIRVLPWVMLVVTAVCLAMQSASKAYSGPRPAEREYLELRIYSAALISVAFGFVFAVGSLRLNGWINRVLSAFIILIQSLALGFAIHWNTRGW